MKEKSCCERGAERTHVLEKRGKHGIAGCWSSSRKACREGVKATDVLQKTFAPADTA